MFVATVPNRKSRPAILLRESYREGRKVRSRTLANLSHWPMDRIEALRQVLRGEPVALHHPVRLEECFEVVRSRPHGHVAAVVGTLRRVGVEALLGAKRTPARDRCVALIAARILEPRSKLAIARGLDPATQGSTLGELVGVEAADEDDLYAAMDWLLPRQARLEDQLAKRHLGEGTFVLYDVTSTYFEGRRCPLARLGHSRDGKKGKLQIVFGMLTNAEGCPIAVEVFEGNTGDPKTVAAQVQKLRVRFALKRLVLVGDRGMLTAARIREDLQPAEGIDWITALRSPAIRQLVEAGTLQLSLFDEQDLAEIRSPDYPGERLIVCKNPLLASERSRKRQELLAATERELEKVAAATRLAKHPLRGKDRIGLRVGKVLGRFKVGKHFRLSITETGFRYEREQELIAAEAALDGIYVIRTSMARESIDAEEAVRSYKRLALVERAFRSLKSVDLHVRPIHHRRAERVRCHVLLCMLAYYVEWHMRRALAPLLFDDDDRTLGERLRASVVAPAQRSPRALQKAHRKRTDEGNPVHSFQTLLQDLATVVKNRIQPKDTAGLAFDKITTPTPIQQKAFDLLGISPWT